MENYLLQKNLINILASFVVHLLHLLAYDYKVTDQFILAARKAKLGDLAEMLQKFSGRTM